MGKLMGKFTFYSGVNLSERKFPIYRVSALQDDFSPVLDKRKLTGNQLLKKSN